MNYANSKFVTSSNSFASIYIEYIYTLPHLLESDNFLFLQTMTMVSWLFNKRPTSYPLLGMDYELDSRVHSLLVDTIPMSTASSSSSFFTLVFHTDWAKGLTEHNGDLYPH